MSLSLRLNDLLGTREGGGGGERERERKREREKEREREKDKERERETGGRHGKRVRRKT